MSSSGLFERSYPGYDVDELIFDLEDSDFGHDLVTNNCSKAHVSFPKNIGIHIRHSKSDSLLVSGYQFLEEATFDGHHYGNVYRWPKLLHSNLDGAEENSAEADTNILTLEGLRNHYNSCFTCGVSWRESHVSLDCSECGGYSMQRPCPCCDGKCQNIWTRDLPQSHKYHKAKWEGECKLFNGSSDKPLRSQTRNHLERSGSLVDQIDQLTPL